MLHLWGIQCDNVVLVWGHVWNEHNHVNCDSQVVELHPTGAAAQSTLISVGKSSAVLARACAVCVRVSDCVYGQVKAACMLTCTHAFTTA